MPNESIDRAANASSSMTEADLSTNEIDFWSNLESLEGKMHACIRAMIKHTNHSSVHQYKANLNEKTEKTLAP